VLPAAALSAQRFTPVRAWGWVGTHPGPVSASRHRETTPRLCSRWPSSFGAPTCRIRRVDRGYPREWGVSGSLKMLLKVTTSLAGLVLEPLRNSLIIPQIRPSLIPTQPCLLTKSLRQ
jgi:hypothetical protein